MLHDVFYIGNKPNSHPRERQVESLEEAIQLASSDHFWLINSYTDYAGFDWDFDFDTLPDEDVWQKDYINAWPSQHQKDGGTWLCPAVKTDVIVYRTDVDPVRRKNEINEHWDSAGYDPLTFDFSWHPDPTDPKRLYRFCTYLNPFTGPTFNTPGNDGTLVSYERGPESFHGSMFPKYNIETTLEELIEQHAGEIFWALNPEIDYSKFDFSWVPDLNNRYHVNCFGTAENKHTQTYFVNTFMWEQGRRELNFVEDTVIDISTKISMFYVDKGNDKRFGKLQERFPEIIKTRYLNSWIDTIQRCANRSETKLFWVLSSEIDYSDFEFNFYPSPWQMDMVHVFGTQWSHWGNTYMVNKESFAKHSKYITLIEHISALNFVKSIRTKAVDCLYDVFLIDHGNESVNQQLLSDKTSRAVTKVPYKHSYLQTLRQLINSLEVKKDHYIWVCSSICDYTDFDFTYICDPYSKEQLHVFPSNRQKFGDTFLLDVNKFREGISTINQLTEFDKVNYNPHQTVARLSCPVFTVEDSQSELVNFDFNFPYCIVKTNEIEDFIDDEPLNIWDRNTTDILVTTTGASRIIVPKEAREFIKGDVYDYPYISKTNKLKHTQPLDIVFLSNGESCADEHYERLLEVSKKFNNRVVRVDGVNGRANAYHAAAKASNTPWFFSVFAKLEVDKRFDFEWQPDRLQERKHYIFHARNPVNGLVYGHQAMIAYNKKLVLSNPGIGLDFTLDSLHEVVEVNSGVARFDTDSYSTWRTSFRECVKLKDTVVHNPSDEVSIKRLKTWASVGNGDYGQDSINGALDAIEYYDSVNGDMDKLKLTYEWTWLKDYYNNKY